MKVAEAVHLVGSGRAGFSMSHRTDSHVYLIEGAEGHILIDAGAGIDPGRILDNITSDGVDPHAIRHLFLTHTHSDHSGGAAFLRDHLGVTVHAPKAEAGFLRAGDGDTLGLSLAIADRIYPADYRYIACQVDNEVSGGDVIEAGGIAVRAIHTPGHSPGSTCYLVNLGGRTCLFSGDTVFHGGRLSFLNCPGSVMADYRATLPRLTGLGIDSLFPGHGCIVLERGQTHIDQAISALSHVRIPPNVV